MGGLEKECSGSCCCWLTKGKSERLLNFALLCGMLVFTTGWPLLTLQSSQFIVRLCRPSLVFGSWLAGRSSSMRWIGMSHLTSRLLECSCPFTVWLPFVQISFSVKRYVQIKFSEFIPRAKSVFWATEDWCKFNIPIFSDVNQRNSLLLICNVFQGET